MHMDDKKTAEKHEISAWQVGQVSLSLHPKSPRTTD